MRKFFLQVFFALFFTVLAIFTTQDFVFAQDFIHPQPCPASNRGLRTCQEYICEGNTAALYKGPYSSFKQLVGQPIKCASACHEIQGGVSCEAGAVEAAPGLAPGAGGQEDATLPTYDINGYPVHNNPSLWVDRDLDFTYRKPQGNEQPSFWSPNKDKQGLRIDSTVGTVMVTFRNLDDSLIYWLCPESDVEKCDKSRLGGKDVKPQGGKINSLVCGDGKKKLKGHQVDDTGKPIGRAINTGADGCTPKDYFHEGFTYHLSLFSDSSGGAPNLDAPFFVKHSYPLVKISSDGTSNFTKDVPIDVNLWGWRDGVQSDNNYQLVLEGLNNSYKKEICVNNPKGIDPKENRTVGINTQWVVIDKNTPQFDQLRKEHDNDLFTGSGWGTPPRGNQLASDPVRFAREYPAGGGEPLRAPGIGSYVLKINERINETGADFRRDSCQGGHSYVYIFFTIDTRATNGIKILDVKYDPNNADWEDLNKDVIGSAGKGYCDPASYDPKTKTCGAINTAIGKVQTTTQGFIEDIFSFVLTLAGFGGIIVLIYSGYLIMRSQGDKEKIAAARETITSAILGLLFIIFSVVILEIIGVDILRIPGITR